MIERGVEHLPRAAFTDPDFDGRRKGRRIVQGGRRYVQMIRPAVATVGDERMAARTMSPIDAGRRAIFIDLACQLHLILAENGPGDADAASRAAAGNAMTKGAGDRRATHAIAHGAALAASVIPRAAHSATGRQISSPSSWKRLDISAIPSLLHQLRHQPQPIGCSHQGYGAPVPSPRLPEQRDDERNAHHGPMDEHHHRRLRDEPGQVDDPVPALIGEEDSRKAVRSSA